ncbi:MAG: S41 family peptidase [Candidatus Paceibacterota bacterium]|jgi:carboxyl-terminal processing protease
MKLENKSTLAGIAAVIIVISFVLGFSIGEGRSPSSVANARFTDVDKVSTEQFDAFWRAWQVLNDKQVNAASTTPEEKIYGAISGLASAYKDPYTVFFPPAESKMFQEDISGDFEGVGMEIGIKNKQLQVVAPIKNSPADKAGVKTGDFILKIGDKTTSNMTVDQAVKLIRGPKGTTVTITFLPANTQTPKDRNLVRDIINIPTLDTSEKGSVASAPGNDPASAASAEGIYVIRLYSFTAQSHDLFRNALRQFVLSGKHKLILDLRGNPGGYLESAWDMASWFLPSGKTVVTEDFGKKSSPKIYYSRGYNIFNDELKMLILVDGGSASASEILAGALQENGVAKLVGSKTFGKGSVQELVSITKDTSLKVTVARWLTPKGVNLSENGLEPDYPVKLTEENVKGGKDPVMEKAVSLLSQEK